MELADTFVPTAGAVGLLPMITYFFLIVAAFTFTGLFILSLSALLSTHTAATRPIPYGSVALTSFLAAVLGITYYALQGFYYTLLAELVSVSDGANRQTLSREAYHALSQYRTMAWFITTPVLLLQVLRLLPISVWHERRLIANVLLGSLATVFFMFIGQQQLSFDNELQTGPTVLWGLVALGAFGYTVFTLNRYQQAYDGQDRPGFRWGSVTLGSVWTLYFIGYFLTLAPIDCTSLQLLFTLADVGSVVSISAIIFLTHTNRWPDALSQKL